VANALPAGGRPGTGLRGRYPGLQADGGWIAPAGGGRRLPEGLLPSGVLAALRLLTGAGAAQAWDRQNRPVTCFPFNLWQIIAAGTWSKRHHNCMTVHTLSNEQITVITLDRATRRNAVDGPTAAALRAAFEVFEADASQRVAILTGAGGHFCGGADLQAMGDPVSRNVLEPDGHGPMGPTRMAFSKPVIAAVEGYAVAGGLELALMCDLRVAARSAIFGVFCRRWGVPLIDGGTVRLPRIVGQGRALDLILTGRAVDAAEALQIGLANRVVDDGQALPAALALAQQIAAFPQRCMNADRASALAQWDWPVAEALKREGHGGQAVVFEEGLAGAARFAGGAGRHGGAT
jgi:enoyl-CoA hydratase